MIMYLKKNMLFHLVNCYKMIKNFIYAIKQLSGLLDIGIINNIVHYMIVCICRKKRIRTFGLISQIIEYINSS